jgi:hypothetical protein
VKPPSAPAAPVTSRSNGFAAIVLSDHVAPTSEVTEVYPPPFYDPLTAIAWLDLDPVRPSPRRAVQSLS